MTQTIAVPLARYGPRALPALTAALATTLSGNVEQMLLPARVAAGDPGAKQAVLAVLAEPFSIEDPSGVAVAARRLGDRTLIVPLGRCALRSKDFEVMVLLQRAFRALAGRSLREAVGGAIPAWDDEAGIDAAVERIQREFGTAPGR
jgi:hypothetical protein